jgi:hypothetical protein
VCRVSQMLGVNGSPSPSIVLANLHVPGGTAELAAPDTDWPARHAEASFRSGESNHDKRKTPACVELMASIDRRDIQRKTTSLLRQDFLDQFKDRRQILVLGFGQIEVCFSFRQPIIRIDVVFGNVDAP